MSFDEIFDHIGGMGHYQIALFAIIELQCMFNAFHAMAAIFLVPDQDHWCSVNTLTSLPYDVQKQVAIPQTDNGYENCDYYLLNYDNYTDAQYCDWESYRDNVTAEPICFGYAFLLSFTTLYRSLAGVGIAGLR